MTDDPYEMLDAAYVMGALEPEERREFEAHMLTCPECAERVEQLRPTIGLLAAARAGGAFDGFDETLSAPPLPETLLPGLLRRAARERTRRRVFTTAIGGVAAACLVALVIVVWPSSGSNKPTPQALQAVQPSPIHATAVLVSKPWGTEIELHCRYDAGVSSGVPYGLRVYDKDGDEEPYSAGTWTLTPGKVTNFTGGVAIARDDISKVQVTLPSGQAILQLTL